MNTTDWIATAIAIPCVATLIAAVTQSLRNQALITSTFTKHVEKQTGALQAITDQLKTLCDKQIDAAGIKAAVEEGTRQNREEHLAITKSLRGTNRVLASICRAIDAANGSQVSDMVHEILKQRQDLLMANQVSAGVVEAEKVLADTVKAKEIIKEAGG